MVDRQRRRVMSLARRLGLLVACAVLGVVVITSILLASERSLIMEERKNNVKQNVEAAHSLIAYYYSLSVAGKLTQVQAQQLAKDGLRAMRYGGQEYFWINDMHPVMVMHPIRPELDGTDVSGNKDRRIQPVDATHS